MRYLDKNWYLKSQKYPPDDETYDAVKALTEAEKKSGVPEELRHDLCFHDGEVISEKTVQSQYLRATTTLCGFAVRSTVTNP